MVYIDYRMESSNSFTFFFQINTLKIFNAIKAGAGLGLATLFKTAASVSYFLIRIAFI